MRKPITYMLQLSNQIKRKVLNPQEKSTPIKLKNKYLPVRDTDTSLSYKTTTEMKFYQNPLSL